MSRAEKRRGPAQHRMAVPGIDSHEPGGWPARTCVFEPTKK